MKYIISESQLEKVIIDYFDEIFPIEEIHWTHPYQEFDDGSEGEDFNRVEFYRGNYEDENTVFRWYDCEYFAWFSQLRERCPIVSLEYPYQNTLEGYFGDSWMLPFKNWFEQKFEFKVKTVVI